MARSFLAPNRLPASRAVVALVVAGRTSPFISVCLKGVAFVPWRRGLPFVAMQPEGCWTATRSQKQRNAMHGEHIDGGPNGQNTTVVFGSRSLLKCQKKVEDTYLYRYINKKSGYREMRCCNGHQGLSLGCNRAGKRPSSSFYTPPLSTTSLPIKIELPRLSVGARKKTSRGESRRVG